MDLEDIPIPPTPPSSSTGLATSKEDGDGGNAANDAWRKAQEALQHIQGDGPGKQQKMAGDMYNPYYQSYSWNMYPNYATEGAGDTPPWMQTAYGAWNQQPAAAVGFQRFGFNSAPTQPNAALTASSASSTFSEQSSSESVTSTPNGRPGFRQQSTPNRALLGDRPARPARPGLGYGNRGSIGSIRFDIGRNRGANSGVQNRFSSDNKSVSSSGGLGFSEAVIDRTGAQGGRTNDGPTDQKKMPEAMEAYIKRAYEAASTPEQQNQVEQALKQRLLPLLHNGEAWRMNWDDEPLPTDNDYALRIIKAQLAARGRGGFAAGSRLLTARGGRGGFTGNSLIPNQQAHQIMGGMGGTQEQQNNNFGLVTQRGRGGLTLRGRGGRRGGFGGRQPLLSRSRSRSRSRSTNDGEHSKDESYRRRKRDSDQSSSDDPSKKRHRGPAGDRRSSASSHESEDTNYGKRQSKKEKWAAMKKKKNRKQKKRYSTEDVDNDDRESGDEQNSSFGPGKGKKQKKKGMKFTMDKHQSKQEQEAAKNQRAMRFAKHMVQPAIGGPSKSLASRLGKRRGNDDIFMDDRSNASPSDSSMLDVEFDPTAFLIVGTCEILEKQYLRLTTVPDPSQVRPEPVLKKALAMVKQKWKEQSEYRYVCDQLKSIRQDMTIQCIRNRFSVDVYETHARIALEKGDREEFNQCQSQLKALYSELPGCPNEYEFTAYRLLFYVYMENTMDITTILACLTPQMFNDDCINFALKIRNAWSLHNYSKFFKLARSGRPPRMCTYVLELFMERERKRALKAMLKAYRPTVPISYITETLAFESEEDCLEFLRQLQVPLAEEDESKIDCRQQVPAF